MGGRGRRLSSIYENDYSEQRVALAFIFTTILYAASGIIVLVISLLLIHLSHEDVGGRALATAVVLSLKPIRFDGGLITGPIVLFAALLAVVGAITKSRACLKASSVVNITSMLATLILGLSIWLVTLTEKAGFLRLWSMQTPKSTMLLQDKFRCCGYLNSETPMFVVSKACPSPDIAAMKAGCYIPFTNFADHLLNGIFTTLFATAGIAFVHLLITLVMTKRITELGRFKAIDEKMMYT